MANVSVTDYLTAPEGLLLRTMRFDAHLTRSSLRSAFADLPSSNASLQRTPRPLSAFPAGPEHGDVWLPWEHNDFGRQLRRAVASRQPGRPIWSFEGFFRRVFGRPPPAVLAFAQGAQFSATRAALRRTPLEAYRWLVFQLEMGVDEIIYYLE